MVKNKDIYFFIFNLLIFILGIVVFLCFYISIGWNGMLIGVIIVFISNILDSVYNLRKKHVLFILYICIFTFLISRPFISMCRGNQWWWVSEKSNKFAQMSILIALVCLRFGGSFASVFQIKTRKAIYVQSDIYNGRVSLIRRFSLALFFIFVLFSYYYNIKAFLSIRGENYASYYIRQTGTPSIIRTLASLTIYPLCVYLATLPKKRHALTIIALYLFSVVPEFFIGARGKLVIAIIFTMEYYLFRQFHNRKEKWIGKSEILFIIIATPLFIAFLGAYNYWREKADSSLNFFEIIVDFFYKQGISYDVLCRAYDAMPLFPHEVPQDFIFGPIIDTFKHGSLAQILFGAKPLGGNSVYHALYGNSFGDTLAYTIDYYAYIEGHGFGSSYILEFYYHLGYLGVIVSSLVLGMLMVYINDWLNKGGLPRILALIILLNIFLIPRAPALGWSVFLFQPQSWVVIIVCRYLPLWISAPRKTLCRINEQEG